MKTNKIYNEDCLSFMKRMDDACIDLCYADPPFNSGRNYTGTVATRSEGAGFNDTWQNMQDYLTYMTLRIIEIRRILKPTGSFYLHCDPSASHYLKVACDGVFGMDNFKNEIIWHYSGGNSSSKHFRKKHDTIFFYSKNIKLNKFNVDCNRVPYSKNSNFVKHGIKSKAGKWYYPNPKGKAMDSVWYIPIINQMAKERTGYPTQKPVKLLERIIKASSNEGDVVLDPFCGSGTTLVAAYNLRRKFIGLDKSSEACEISKSRFI